VRIKFKISMLQSVTGIGGAFAGCGKKKDGSIDPHVDEERLIRERLAGLGYV
jgi:hypothetical protein